MIKYIFIIGSVFLMLGVANAQHSMGTNNNPFKNLKFLNSPTDTISFIVSYNHIAGPMGKKNTDLLSLISYNDGSNIKKMKYAIGFTIPGYSQKFYVPCNDNDKLNTLTSQQNGIDRLKINCVVYRFYYMDITTNFFYVDKVDILR